MQLKFYSVYYVLTCAVQGLIHCNCRITCIDLRLDKHMKLVVDSVV